jgi:hypothetical protein
MTDLEFLVDRNRTMFEKSIFNSEAARRTSGKSRSTVDPIHILTTQINVVSDVNFLIP